MNHFFWNYEFIINKLQSDKGIGSYCIIQIKKIIKFGRCQLFINSKFEDWANFVWISHKSL